MVWGEKGGKGLMRYAQPLVKEKEGGDERHSYLVDEGGYYVEI